MVDANIIGNVEAFGETTDGKIVLCPTTGRSSYTACSAYKTANHTKTTPTGTTTIGTVATMTGPMMMVTTPGITSTAEATSTIQIGKTVLSTTTTTHCAKTTGKEEITGCAHPDYTVSPDRPRYVPLPDDVAPISATHSGTTAQKAAYTTWTADGYTVDTPATTCTTTTTGSVYADLTAAATATKPTVIVANCKTTAVLTLTKAGPMGMLNLTHTVALFATNGIKFGSYKFMSGGGPMTKTTKYLDVIVPTPTTSYSCTSKYGITFAAGSAADIQNQLDVFLYTPCKLTVSDNVSLTGQIVVGSTLSITTTKKLTVTPKSLTIPDFSFGYQEYDEARYVTKG
jgi:hypothetical protein